MKSQAKFILAFFVLTVAGLIFVGCEKTPPNSSRLVPVRLTVTPFQDTTLMLIGKEKGFFKDEGIDLQIVDSNWSEQPELLAGNAADIAMATLDELVVKDKNLRKIGREAYYVLPAWLFEGMIFVSGSDIQTVDEIRQQGNPDDAPRIFLEQLKGKKIALPTGGVYEEALRNFIKNAGFNPDELTIINSKLEVGINGLEDPTVGLAAAGIVQRLEAQRRGYKIALETRDLGITVITGFVARGAFYNENPDTVTKFACAWYKSVQYALANLEENYEVVKAYIDGRGAKVPSFEDFETALTFQKIARTPSQAQEWFLDPDSVMYWEQPWDSTVENLKATGKESDIPTSKESFVAAEVLQKAAQMCPK